MIIAVIIYKSTAVIKGTLNDLKNVTELGTLTTLLILCPVAHLTTKDMYKKIKRGIWSKSNEHTKETCPEKSVQVGLKK